MAGSGVLEFVREEDYVEYFLFPEEIGNTNPEEVKQCLNDNFSLISCTVSEYKHDYIWHKDPFNVAAVFDSDNADNTDLLPPHLHGITHYGDNIEDEWFVVYLLLQLTKDIEGLVVRVVDSDGEFLLIEAAEHLPSWANPETCQQRVYLFNGTVHLIPVPPGGSKKGKKVKIPTVSSAVQLIRTSPEVTCAPASIQNAIQTRIEGYPDKIKQNLHRATVCVPVGVAALLNANPSLISPAVRAFCHRDPIDMRACRAMRFFPPENCVLASVTFTRCLYAMISHHKFTPDRRTGWVIPPTNSKNFKAYNLGVKVACGFEILANQAKPSGTSQNNKETDTKETSTPCAEDVLKSKGWSLYHQSLKKQGYFKDLLEGSKEYNQLLEKAQTYYVSVCTTTQQGSPELSTGQEILKLMGTLEYDLEEMKKSSQNLPPPDDESWLEISPEELEKILGERYGCNGENDNKNSTNPTDMTAALNNFLEHMSGLEGAEFPKVSTGGFSSGTEETLPTRPKRGVKKGKKAGNIDNLNDMTRSMGDEMTNSMLDNRLNFDPDAFSCAVQNILDLVIPEDSWDMDSGSDDSDMGSSEDETEMDLEQIKTGKVQSPETELKQYMDQMDRELASTTLAQSFEKKNPTQDKKAKGQTSKDDDSFDDIEDFEPVDIDMNALKNILESYQSQLGGAGPASNLLGPMGVHLDTLASNSADDVD